MTTTTTPDHVPESLVVDFDVYNPLEPGDEYHDPFIRQHAAGIPPIFWSPHNGGHWVATAREALWDIFPDHEKFSSKYLVVPVSRNPTGDQRAVPIQSDPPEHGKYRSLFAPAFILPMVKAREAEVRALAVELSEGLKPAGRCDFTADFAQHLPMKVFMNMVDLPERDRVALIALADRVVGPDGEDNHAVMAEIAAYLAKVIQARMAAPGDDLISKIATAEIDGAPIGFNQAVGVCSLLLIGGLDTVASMMSFSMNYLATHPEQRRMLVENPALIPGAVDEFLRRFALTSPGRVVVEDMTFQGVEMKAGDMMVLATPFGALDPAAYENAAAVDFTRKSPFSTTFGNGHHRCPGNMLARAELRVMLEEWLARIPDFERDDTREAVIRPGINGSIASLPLRWSVA